MNLFAVVSENTVALLAVFVGGVLVQVITGVLTWMKANQAANAAEAQAKKAELDRRQVKEALERQTTIDQTQKAEVSKKLETTNKKIESKLDVVHGLVNSNMLAQMKILAITARRLSDFTKSPEDVKFAEEAENVMALQEKKIEGINLDTLKSAEFPVPTEKIKLNP